MTDNENQIINYEEIFKEEIESKPPVRTDSANANVLTLLTYFVLFFLGLGALIVSGVITLVGGKTPTNVLLSKFTESSSPGLVTVIPLDEYQKEVVNFDTKLTAIEFTYSKLDGTQVFVTTNVDTDNINWLTDDVIKDILEGKVTTWFTLIDEEPLNITFVYIDDTALGKLLADNEFNNFIATNQYTNLQNNLILFFTYLIVFVVLVIMNRNVIKEDYLYLKNEYHPMLEKVFSGFAYMLIVTFASGMLTQLLKQVFNIVGDSANQESIEAQLKSKGGIFVILTVVILAPVVEELVFRKAIFGVIKNPKVALGLAGVTFGAIHITTELMEIFMYGTFSMQAVVVMLVMSIQYIAVGLFLSYWYYKNNKNITLLILMHALSNLLSVFATFFQ